MDTPDSTTDHDGNLTLSQKRRSSSRFSAGSTGTANGTGRMSLYRQRKLAEADKARFSIETSLLRQMSLRVTSTEANNCTGEANLPSGQPDELHDESRNRELLVALQRRLGDSNSVQLGANVGSEAIEAVTSEADKQDILAVKPVVHLDHIQPAAALQQIVSAAVSAPDTILFPANSVDVSTNGSVGAALPELFTDAIASAQSPATEDLIDLPTDDEPPDPITPPHRFMYGHREIVTADAAFQQAVDALCSLPQRTKSAAALHGSGSEELAGIKNVPKLLFPFEWEAVKHRAKQQRRLLRQSNRNGREQQLRKEAVRRSSRVFDYAHDTSGRDTVRRCAITDSA